jgi:hypothetical protein
MKREKAERCKELSAQITDKLLAMIKALDSETLDIENSKDIKIIFSNVVSLINYEVPEVIYKDNKDLNDRSFSKSRSIL